MMRSLKLRIALLTSLITTGIVTTGSIYMVHAIRISKIERIDEETKRLSITSIPKLIDVRSPRERGRSGPPLLQQDLELQEGFWISIVRPNGTTAYHTQGIPSAWFETYPMDPMVSENPFLRPVQRIPLGRLFSEPDREPIWKEPRESIPDRLSAELEFTTIQFDDQRFRIGTIVTPSDFEISFGRDLSDLGDEMEEIQKSILTTIPAFIIITILASAFLSNRALSPFKKLSEKIDTVSASGLDARLDTEKLPKEFSTLTLSINDMMERLDRSFHQANRFTADASHELRTPLTILKGHLEKLLQAEPDTTQERQEEYANLLDEVERLQRLSSQLLFLARSDSGNFELHAEEIDLYAQIKELVNDFRDLYPDFQFDLEGNAFETRPIDWHILQQAIVNLLGNAVNYNNEAQQIKVSFELENQDIVIRIANTGIAIPSEMIPHLFVRFYRADMSRGRSVSSGGTGLGLSIAAECVSAHEGSLSYEGFSQGMNVFKIFLPGNHRTH